MTILNRTFRNCLFAASLAIPLAAGAEPSYSFTIYVQQAWPQQDVANRQIQEINQTFGTNFDDWSDVPNLSVGAQLFWLVAPEWQLGLQVDYGSGSIDGSDHVATEAGPARLSFEQRYDIYLDLYAAAKWTPRVESERVRPFLYGAVGMAYESDVTTLRLRNEFIDSGLRVENDGWFPTYSAGLGVDVPFTAQSPWFFELGFAYVWAHMDNKVPVHGDLVPYATVTADTELTGPNYWLGVGRSF